MKRLVSLVVCGCVLAALAVPAGAGTRTYYSDGTNCERSPDA